MTPDEKKMVSVLGEDLIREVNNNFKFYAGKKLDKVKMNFGMETLYYVAQLEAANNRKLSHNPQGLLRTLDIMHTFHNLDIIHWQSILKLRAKLFGKKYVRDCCNYTIFRGYAMDLDIVKTLRDMHIESKRKRLANKTSSSNELEV